ncbi:XrtA/PEP-CTERM system TPR-repeat protein PrsT [Inhella proteolytica]|uniref:PEP-CTERM system TPR-repeat protein PrsT n=1 Tax=Inhella proteolytica TaxID=2795029 RepID=A0A931J0M0_9BURK|nr:XrtA/PEP-CTERM system TPR-repeat protein PrsT [Inhella proteolytica]MBH9576533.1 PEP-CTERM system TPR-repeat protein PrsT [Inhella proteolytica]
MHQPSSRNRTRVSALLFCAFALSACNTSNGDGVALGKQSLAEANTPAAIIHFKSALQQDPQRWEARALLGQSLLRVGDVNGAAIELEKALEGGYSREVVVPSLASALLRQGKHQALFDRFGNTSLTDPAATASLQTTLAVAHWQREDRSKAQAALDRALAAQPNFGMATLLKAQIAAADGDFDRALELTQLTLKHNEKDLQALLLLAALQGMGKGDQPAATATLERALVVEPKFIDAHKALVFQALQSGDMALTERRLDRLRAVAPKHSVTSYLSAFMAYAQRDFKQARALAEPLLKASGNNPQVLVLAALIEEHGGSLLQAEAHLGKAINLAPGEAQPRVLLANLFLRKGQEARALATVEPLLNARPPQPLALALAADAYLRRGEREKAEALYAEAAKLAPADSRSSVALASLRATQGDGESGLRELEMLSRSAKPQDIYADLALFNAHMRKRDFPGALKSAEQLIAKQPKQATPWIMKAGVYELMDDGINAKAALEKAVELEPRNLRAVLRLTDYDTHLGQPEKAVERLKSLADAGSIQAELALAARQRRAGQTPEQALEALRQIAQKHRKEPEARLALVQELLSQGLSAAALDEAQSALSVLPDDLGIMVALGTAQLQAKKGEEAVNTFRKVASADPGNVQVQYRVAEALLTNGRQAESVATLRRILETRPDFLPAQRALASILVRSGDSNGALKIARSIQSKRPESDFGHLLEGDIEAGRKRWAAGIAAYRRALAKSPSGEAAAKLHTTLQSAGDSKVAGQFAAQWRNDHPDDSQFLSHLSGIALQQGRYDEAEALLQAVLKLSPGRATAWANLAFAKMKLGHPGAIDDARKAVQLAPQEPALHHSLAQVLEADRQWAPALEAAQRAVKASGGNNPAFRLTVARLYAATGDKEAARRELKALSDLAQDFEGKAEALELLRKL